MKTLCVGCVGLMATGLTLAAAVERPEVDLPLVIRGATVLAEPGAPPLENATIVIRNGRIEAAREGAVAPAGARVIDGSGQFVYAGFVDGFTRVGVQDQEVGEDHEKNVEGRFPDISENAQVATVAANRSGIHVRRRVEEFLKIEPETFKDMRAAGFTAALLAPPNAILAGRASLISLGEEPVRSSVLAGGVGQAASFATPRRHLLVRGRYPGTLLGVMAHLRQFFEDARWHAETARWRASAGAPLADSVELPFDPDLELIQPMLRGEQRVFWAADNVDEIDRVLMLAREFALKPIIVGGRQADRLAQKLKAADVPVVLSLELPKPAREYKVDVAALTEPPVPQQGYGKAWDERSFYPSRAYDEAKTWRSERERVAQALETAGVRWCFSSTGMEKPERALQCVQAFVESGLSPDAALRALTTTPAELLGVSNELGRVRVGMRAHLTMLNGPLGDKDAEITRVIVAGREYRTDAAERREPAGQRTEEGGAVAATESAESQSESAGAPPAAATPVSGEAARSPLVEVRAHVPAWPIETPADRVPRLHTGGTVLLKNATVIAITGEDLENTSVLIEAGKIKAIGRDLQAPADVKAIDLSGYTLMPGVLDPHSHIAAYDVNEWTMSVTPEVRMADVIRRDDSNLYFALAGGCTAAHVMHGSANTIGGQNVLLKLKYGRPAEDLVLPNQHRTVKFALGENVKRPGMDQDRWDSGSPRRFPGTRMGVETVMRRALDSGRRYLQELKDDREARTAGKNPPPLRRDLRREALADILRGDIWVNTHSYRAEEILRLFQVAEDFGFRIAALHHCLEAYRIIPEIARHGAATATFSDWWAYKIEAYDAVPQNAGMLLRGGVNSTLKSDSGELMRHMPLEAAKCMRSSGLSANEALRMVTLNAATMFGLQDRIGSIEVGKDGDIAVYNGHPLDTFSHCVLTLIEGEIYFQHRDFDADSPQPPAHTPVEFAKASARVIDLTGDGSGSVPKLPGAGADAAEQPATNGDASGRTIYAIVNATLHPVSRPAMEQGTLIIESGRIAAVGQVFQIPPGATVIDAKGLHVWPGLINAATTVGLYEIGQVSVTVDTSETGTYQPDLLAVSAFNPHSAMVDVTRAEGITSALVIPNGPAVCGQAGLVNLDGWTLDEMLIEPRVGLVVNLPSEGPKGLLEDDKPWRDPNQPEPDEPIDRSLAELRRFFEDARAYALARDSGELTTASDSRFEEMRPYVLGRKPVLFRAGGYKHMLEVLQFADSLGLKPVILGGSEAWKLADLLAARKVPVIYEGTMDMPADVPLPPYASDAWDSRYQAAGVMSKAGVSFCAAHQGADLAKLLPLEMGMAVSHGLDSDAAMRASTLSAAEILGVADQLGSLDVGKVANVIVTTDHPCRATTRVEYEFIGGRPVALESKHTRDAAGFAQRPAPTLPPPRTDLAGPPSQTK